MVVSYRGYCGHSAVHPVKFTSRYPSCRLTPTGASPASAKVSAASCWSASARAQGRPTCCISMTNSAMDPETTDGLAKPYYEKVMDMLLSKNEPKYNSALIECYSYLGYYYLLKSDYPTSKEFWNKILAIDPTNATAKKALEGIK